MDKQSHIYVAGHTDLMGISIMRELFAAEHTNGIVRSRKETDLDNQCAVMMFLEEVPDYVFIAEAKVGAFFANNTNSANITRSNLMVKENIFLASLNASVKKLLFLRSSYIKPKLCLLPIKVKTFQSGALDPTNEFHANGNIARINVCQACHRQHGFDAISHLPTSHGPVDNVNLKYACPDPQVPLRQGRRSRRSGHMRIWNTHTRNLAGQRIRDCERAPDADQTPSKGGGGGHWQRLNYTQNYRIFQSEGGIRGENQSRSE